MSLTMKGTSRLSLVATRTSLDKKLSGLDSAAILKLSSDLFAMVQVLDSSIALRRALTDSARQEAEKNSLAAQLFSKVVAPGSLALLSEMIAMRWSSPKDLGDVLELLAVESQAAAAEKDGTLDRLEAEIFTFSQTVASSPELRAVLANRSTVPGQPPKSQLVSALLSGKATASTVTLISTLVDHSRGRNIESGLAEFAQAVSARKNRLIAHVTTAVELTSQQVERLSKSLSQKIGQQVRVNVAVDKNVVGGISIRFADELIDGTLITRLLQADRALASKSA
ncbi:unannotated protein [freshwater metagenome]|uniref:Unannotated protein n=1 Tax=freshwater metagenome TaxID=449393 RepID=A0A6J7A9H4_9ZZZZ|nr:F0F1 ATP synthase subunit delta [Actinomycetota bacterium]